MSGAAAEPRVRHERGGHGIQANVSLPATPTRTCSGTPAGSSWPTKDMTPGRSSITSGTRTSRTPSATPNSRRIGSRDSGGIDQIGRRRHLSTHQTRLPARLARRLYRSRFRTSMPYCSTSRSLTLKVSIPATTTRSMVAVCFRDAAGKSIDSRPLAAHLLRHGCRRPRLPGCL